MARENVHGFPDLLSASDFLKQELRAGDLVLLRGRSSEHVTRIFFAQLAEVKCSKPYCPQMMLCDICPELGTPQHARRKAVPVPPPKAYTDSQASPNGSP